MRRQPALITYLEARPGSPLGELAERELARDGELEDQRDQSYEHPLMGRAEQLEKGVDQLRLELTGYDARGNVRLEVARYLERTVIPELWHTECTAEGGAGRRRAPLGYVRDLPGKLRDARQTCWFQLNMEDGGTRTIWDQKAGEPLLCPDDAREEGMRLQRRLEDRIKELAEQGLRVYYGVLTIENADPGGLQTRIAKLWRKFKRALKAKKSIEGVRKKDQPSLFPIVGAIATLEAPLSASRTWHPHLNVILVTRGFFDYETWWPHWGCVSHFQHLKPGKVGAAFRELIKYAVRAVPEKSAAKAGSNLTCQISSSNSVSSSSAASSAMHSGASPQSSSTGTKVSGSASASATAAAASRRARAFPPGPAMIHWTAAEWLEWWQAVKGRRRTRTYGELYGLNLDVDPPEGAWVTIGKGHWAGIGFEARFELLECIPGDKSIRNIALRYRKWLAEMSHPPDWYRETLELTTQALQAIEFWQMEP